MSPNEVIAIKLPKMKSRGRNDQKKKSITELGNTECLIYTQTDVNTHIDIQQEFQKRGDKKQIREIIDLDFLRTDGNYRYTN